MQHPAEPAIGREPLRYHRIPRPLVFPTEATVPETKRHLRLRTLLFDILRRAMSDRVCVGSEQFVYYDASDPSRCLAPDVFVRVGTPDFAFDRWMVWKLGAPELAVEFVSDDDRPERAWTRKLERYHQLGVVELLRFDADAPEAERIRVWDRVGDDLVERVVEGDVTLCQPLGLWWVVRPLDEQIPATLRLSEDREGTNLLPSADDETAAALRRVEQEQRRAEQEQRRAEQEQRRAEQEQRRAEQEQLARSEAERARDKALERIALLETELGKGR